MRKNTQLDAVTAESVQVGDCSVWEKVAYLDSPTDYREYLPSAVQSQATTDLVLLDDQSVICLSKKWSRIRYLLTSPFQIASRL
jgi:hypothetical protein